MEEVSPLSFAVKVTPFARRLSQPSVEAAASLLSSCIQQLDDKWIANQPNNAIVRVTIDCTADADHGSSFALALLCNLSHNAYLPSDMERLTYVNRTGSMGVLGYGCCVRAKTMNDFELQYENRSHDVVAMGGETFEQQQQEQQQESPPTTRLGGWLVPLVEVRSSSAASNSSSSSSSSSSCCWPCVQLAVNIHLQGNDHFNQSLRPRLIRLLQQLRWSFSYHPSMAVHIPPIAVARYNITNLDHPPPPPSIAIYSHTGILKPTSFLHISVL